MPVFQYRVFASRLAAMSDHFGLTPPGHTVRITLMQPGTNSAQYDGSGIRLWPYVYRGLPLGPGAPSIHLLVSDPDACETIDRLEQMELLNLQTRFKLIQGQQPTIEAHQVRTFTLEHVLRCIEDAEDHLFEHPILFCILEKINQLHTIWKFFARKIKACRPTPQRSKSCFCGLRWSKRIWFILHGSHPPKAEAWFPFNQVFGCA